MVLAAPTTLCGGAAVALHSMLIAETRQECNLPHAVHSDQWVRKCVHLAEQDQHQIRQTSELCD
eukprot:1215636-Amphidinium_carterae.1